MQPLQKRLNSSDIGAEAPYITLKKAASKENIVGIKIKKQDTSPSYSFGESGIDPNEKNYKSGN